MPLFQDANSDKGPQSGLTDSLLLKMIFLLLSMILCSLLGTLLIQLWSYTRGVDLATVLAGLHPESKLAERNYVRTAHLLNQLTTFAAPTLLMAWFFYRKQMWRYLRLVPAPALLLLGLGVLIILFCFPLIQVVYWFNQQIPLPDWMAGMEQKAGRSIEALLVMDSPWVFLFNLIVIALLPAVGEELLFRGILQQELEKRIARPHLAIWITALIFSAFHFQFAGFLPRLLLGGLLGYLVFWTRSLWIPIAAHLVFNGSQVAGHYWLGEELIATDTGSAVAPNWGAAGLSLIVAVGLLYMLRRYAGEIMRD